MISQDRYVISLRERGTWSPLVVVPAGRDARAEAADMAQDAEAVILAKDDGWARTPVAAWRRDPNGKVGRCTVREALAA